MKLRAPRAGLAAAAVDATRALVSRPIHPLMNGVVVEAMEGGEVTISGYDYDTYVRATTEAQVLEPGTVLVPGRMLAGFLGAMGEGPVEMVDEGSRLRISGAGCRYGLNTLSLEDYPTLPSSPPVVGRVDGAALAGVVPRALVSARVGDGKIWWHAVIHFEATPEALLIGASDGNSATRYSVPWLDDAPTERLAGEMSGRVLADAMRGMSDGPVSLCMDDAEIGLQSPSRTVMVRRIGEQYVNWRRVVEQLPTPTTVVRLDRDQLIGAMQRAQQVLSGGAEAVRLRIGGGELTYDVAAASGSEVDGAIGLDDHQGDELELGVSPQLVSDAAKAAHGPLIELSLAGPSKVFVVRDVAETGGDLQLVMPKRLLVAR